MLSFVSMINPDRSISWNKEFCNNLLSALYDDPDEVGLPCMCVSTLHSRSRKAMVVFSTSQKQQSRDCTVDGHRNNSERNITNSLRRVRIRGMPFSGCADRFTSRQVGRCVKRAVRKGHLVLI